MQKIAGCGIGPYFNPNYCFGPRIGIVLANAIKLELNFPSQSLAFISLTPVNLNRKRMLTNIQKYSPGTKSQYCRRVGCRLHLFMSQFK